MDITGAGPTGRRPGALGPGRRPGVPGPYAQPRPPLLYVGRVRPGYPGVGVWRRW